MSTRAQILFQRPPVSSATPGFVERPAATSPIHPTTTLGVMLLCVLFCAIVLLTWSTVDEFTLLAQPVAAGALTFAAIALNGWLFRLRLNSFVTVALSCYAAFHLLEIVPVQLGLCDEVFTRASHSGFRHAVLLYDLFLVGCEFGICCGVLTNRRSKPARRHRNSDGAQGTALWPTGQIMAIAGLALCVVGIIQLGPIQFLLGDYADTFRLRTEVDPRAFTIGLWAMPCGLLIMLAGAMTRRRVQLCAIASLAVFVFCVLLGNRGQGYTFVLAALVIAFRRRFAKRLWRVGLLLGILVIFMSPILKSMRQLPMAERFSTAALPSLVSLWDGPREIGGTFRSLVYAVELVPGRGDFWYGRSYTDAFSRLWPNLNLSWTASYFDTTRQMRVGEWLTYTLMPGIWRAYGGDGSSGIAEPYVNFGAIGVPIHFAVLFFLLYRFDRTVASKGSKVSLAIGAVFLMPVCWSARDDVYSIVRPALWAIVVIWLGVRVFSRRRTFGRGRRFGPVSEGGQRSVLPSSTRRNPIADVS